MIDIPEKVYNWVQNQWIYFEKDDSDSVIVHLCNGVKKGIILPEGSMDNLISRQMAIDCLTATGLKKFDFILDAREKIRALPSVKPEQKIGQWIIYDVHGHKACKCSKCNNDVGYPCSDKYCKHCGTKMESEE